MSDDHPDEFALDLTDVAPAADPLPAPPDSDAGANSADPEAPAPLPYYSPSQGDLPARAAAALRGFPHPTGPRGHWPLSESDLLQLAETASYRAPIRRAAALYLALFVAGALLTANQLALLLIRTARYNAVGRTPDEASSAQALVWAGIFGGLSVLCLLAARGAHRCQLWAPIAMIVHFAGWVFYFGYEFVRALPDFRLFPQDALAAASGAVPPAIFIVISAQMLTTLRKFLRRPLWTIHALISAKA